MFVTVFITVLFLLIIDVFVDLLFLTFYLLFPSIDFSLLSSINIDWQYSKIVGLFLSFQILLNEMKDQLV
jgi:hypothetical protein